MKYAVGIDTGGTCTDVVLVDRNTGKPVASYKTPTTHDDLARCISAGLSYIPREYYEDIDFIALSTTLATNACVENKGCRAKLVLIGTDRKSFDQVAAKNGLPDPSVVYLCDKNIVTEDCAEPDWEKFTADMTDFLSDADSVAVVEFLSMKNGARCERRAAEIISNMFDGNVVCGHEMFADLNIYRRGSGTLLNARLLFVIRDFMKAVRVSAGKLGISAPLMLVRSDASLMNENFALSYPVETILSGPAASVLGGTKLSCENEAVIIDMGGTTTDLSVVTGGFPVRTEDGIEIGEWRTFVKGLFVDTFALGGDTRVYCGNSGLVLDTVRAVPLCMAAVRFPELKKRLEGIIENDCGYSPAPVYEFYYLNRHDADVQNYDERETQVISILGDGIMSYGDIASELGLTLYDALPLERLLSEGTVMRCGVTPTDVMHVKGDFDAYDREAAVLAVKALTAAVYGKNSIEEENGICDKIYGMVKKRLYEKTVTMLIKRRYPDVFRDGPDCQMIQIIGRWWDEYTAGVSYTDDFRYRTSAVLVGIGGPTHVFLEDVAYAMGTHCIIPEYSGVANAIGAVMCDVRADARADIGMIKDETGLVKYMEVFLKDEKITVSSWKDAVKTAEEKCRIIAEKEARDRGAGGDITFSTEVYHSTAQNNQGGSISVGGRVIVTAICSSDQLFD